MLSKSITVTLIALTMPFFGFNASARPFGCGPELKETGLVRLKKSKVDAELANFIRGIRAKVKTELGWLPVIKRVDRTSLGGLSDVKIFHPKKTNRGSEIGSTSFRIRGDVLEFNNTEVSKKYWGNKLSELMLAEILAYYPGINEIAVEHVHDTNGDLLWGSYDDRGCEGAMSETTVAKSAARLGFVQMVDAKCINATFRTVNFNGKEYQMVDQEGDLSFRVRRP